MNLNDLRLQNASQVMIVDGQSHYYFFDGYFEYIDLASEFQFLVIKLLKVRSEISVIYLEELFGITNKMAQNVLSRMKKLGLVNQDGDSFQLSPEGKKITNHESIKEVDVVPIKCEICDTSNTFMGIIHDETNQEFEKVSSVQFDFDTMLNKPENLESIGDQISQGNSYQTQIMKSDQEKWKIISTTNNYVYADDVNPQLNEYDQLYNDLVIFSHWVNNSNHSLVNYLQENIFEIKLNSLKELESITIKCSQGQYLLFMAQQSRSDIKFAHRVKLIGVDELSTSILTISDLKEINQSIWRKKHKDINQIIQNIWISNGGKKANPPSIKTLLGIAHENELFELVNSIRLRGDFLD